MHSEGQSQPSHRSAAPAPRRSRSPAPRERSRSPGRSCNQRPTRADDLQDARAEERETPRKRGCERSRSRERDASLPRVLCLFGCGESFKPGATPRLAGRAPGQCACRRFARLAAALESDRALARARARLSLPTGHLKWCRVRTGRGRSRSPDRLASGERDGRGSDSRRERRSNAPDSTPNGKLCNTGCGTTYSPGADPRLGGRAPGHCAWRCCACLAAALESDRAMAHLNARAHGHLPTGHNERCPWP